MAALPSDLAKAVKRSSVVRVSVLAVFIAGTAIAGHLFSAWTDPLAELREWLQQASGAGSLLFLVLFLALNTVGVPAPVLGAAAGAAFGPVSGAAVTLVALTITACAQFLLARHVVGERVRQRLGHALGRVSQLLERRGVRAVAGATPAGTLQRIQHAGRAHFVEAAGLHARDHSRLRPEGTGLVRYRRACLLDPVSLE
jgi:hypothetical protein